MRLRGYFEGKKPFVKIRFKGYKKPVEVLIDTGFSGYLALPQKLINKLKLKRIGEGRYLTAHGKYLIIKVYLAFIHLFGKIEKVTVIVTKGSHALVGMSLFYNRTLKICGVCGDVVITNKPHKI